MDDHGLFKDNDYKKFSFSTKVDANLSKRVTVGINIRPSYSKQRRSTLGLHDFARTYGWLPYYHDSLTTSLTVGNEIGAYAHPRDFTSTQATDVDGNYLYDDNGNPETVNLWSSGNNNPGSRMYHIGFSYYAACMYGFLWADIYAKDMFSIFKKHGVFNPKIGAKFRQCILAPGSSKPAIEMAHCFLGRSVDESAFLHALGLVNQ
ncbi:hypothetical protein ES708_14887 [subsurface metagenome]